MNLSKLLDAAKSIKEKTAYPHNLSVGYKLATGTIDTGAPSRDLIREGDHVEYSGFCSSASSTTFCTVAIRQEIVLPGDCHNLIVADIVVCLPDTSAVPTSGVDDFLVAVSCIVI